jgi:hypothetical protein
MEPPSVPYRGDRAYFRRPLRRSYSPGRHGLATAGGYRMSRGLGSLGGEAVRIGRQVSATPITPGGTTDRRHRCGRLRGRSWGRFDAGGIRRGRARLRQSRTLLPLPVGARGCRYRRSRGQVENNGSSGVYHSNGERHFAGMRKLSGKLMDPPGSVSAVPLMYGIRACKTERQG